VDVAALKLFGAEETADDEGVATVLEPGDELVLLAHGLLDDKLAPLSGGLCVGLVGKGGERKVLVDESGDGDVLVEDVATLLDAAAEGCGCGAGMTSVSFLCTAHARRGEARRGEETNR